MFGEYSVATMLPVRFRDNYYEALNNGKVEEIRLRINRPITLE